MNEGPPVMRSMIWRKNVSTQAIMRTLTAGVHPPIPNGPYRDLNLDDIYLTFSDGCALSRLRFAHSQPLISALGGIVQRRIILHPETPFSSMDPFGRNRAATLLRSV